MATETASPTPTKTTPAAEPSDQKFTLENLKLDPLVADPDAPVEDAEEKPEAEEPEKPEAEEPEAAEEAPEGEEKEETEEATKDESKPAGKRDYSKFPPEIQPLMKQMSREAFEKIGPILLDSQAKLAAAAETQKALEAQIAESKGEKLPDSWYSHPEAYKLTPQYAEVEKKFTETQKQVDYWTGILDGIDDNTIRYDGSQFVQNTDENFKNPPSVRRAVADKRTEAYEQAKELASKGNALAEKFQIRHTKDAEHLTKRTDQIFPWLKDEKHENQDAFKRVLADFPETFRGHQVTKFAAAASVIALRLLHQNQELQAQLKAKTSLKDDMRKAGPVPGKKTKTSATHEDQKFTEKDLVGL